MAVAHLKQTDPTAAKCDGLIFNFHLTEVSKLNNVIPNNRSFQPIS